MANARAYRLWADHLNRNLTKLNEAGEKRIGKVWDIKDDQEKKKWDTRDKFEKHINSSKNIKSYVLPSPSRNGLRSIKRATYLDLKFKENESSTDFRKRCYIDILRG